MLNLSYRTAIKRPGKGLSKPIRILVEKGVLIGQKMDYGSGRGYDANHYGMSMFDPYYFPLDHKERYYGVYNTIICQYVLNVLPPEEQEPILKEIEDMLLVGGKAYIIVRRDIKKEGPTTRDTYQRNVVLDLPVFYKESAFCIYELHKSI